MTAQDPTPLERLLDALQAALLTVREIERRARDQVDDCAQLRAALDRAGQQAQRLRPTRPDGAV